MRVSCRATTPVELASEKETMIDDEHETQNENASEGEEPQPCDEEELLQADNSDREVEECNIQPMLHRSTRDRHPGQMFTYTSLGQPTYQPRVTVNAVETQPTVYNYQYTLPYFHSFPSAPIILSTYLPTTYPIHCYWMINMAHWNMGVKQPYWRVNLFTVCILGLCSWSKIKLQIASVGSHFCLWGSVWYTTKLCTFICISFCLLNGHFISLITQVISLFHTCYGKTWVCSTKRNFWYRGSCVPGCLVGDASAHLSDVTWTTKEARCVLIAANTYLCFTGQ